MTPEKAGQIGKRELMAVKRIEISGLFGRFNHVLEFSEDEPIMIMTSPNGFGKTMILNAINVLFNHSPRSFAKLPFSKFSVKFSDASRIDVSRINTGEEQVPDVEISYTDANSDLRKLKVEHLLDRRLSRHIEDFIPSLHRVGEDVWVNQDTDEYFTLDEIVETFGDDLPWREVGQKYKLPEWFVEIREAISVRLIDTERLTSPFRHSRRVARTRLHPGRKALFDRTINQYSQDLSDKVNHSIAKYGALSQTLDRTFPSRVVEETLQDDVTMEHLRKELAEVEDRRKRLVDAGLLAQEREDWSMPSTIKNIDPAKQGLLAVYARDAREKLSLFDDLYRKVDTLKRIANERLLHKTVSVNADGLRVINDEGSNLNLDTLSSGEQHELVILYELLFRVPDNGFILFDEPELSLHVAWQEKFLEDLLEMAEISNFQVLLATHSPQIIGDHWDMTVELKGPNGR